MKKNKIGKISITLVILTLIVFGLAMILSKNNDEKKEIIDSASNVKRNYAKLTEGNMENITIRKEILTKLDAFTNKDYPSLHEEYQKTLEKYNNNINDIKTYVSVLDEECDYSYEDGTINVFCRSYKGIYEEVVNIYISIITEYNNKITEFNKTSKEKYELFTMVYNEYIDVNNDGKYQGKDFSNNN